MNEERIAELLLHWEEPYERGEDIAADALCADCPELVGSLRKRIDALKRMGWMTRPTTDPKVGSVLAGRYRIDELIGEGGHGKVYRGYDPELDRPVAVKVPHDDRSDPADLVGEARRLARLRHLGIVAVHDVGRHEGTPFIVSDFVDGTTLADKPKPVPAQEAVRLVADTADALHAAHREGFVHRDIKPANVLIDPDQRPLLADFGIAVVTDDLRPELMGTLAYMAPERIAEGAAADRRSDIWSMGVVLYELLTGKLPFDDPSPSRLCEQIAKHVPLPPSAVNRTCPRNWSVSV